MDKLVTFAKRLGPVRIHFKRCYGVTAVLMQKTPTDPVQKLFVEKIREYAQKSKSASGKLVDATPESEKELKDEMEKIERQYGGGPGIDLTKFPALTFKDIHVDPINAAQMEKK